MEALLIDRWLDGEPDALRILDEASVSLARQRARAAGEAAGLPPADVARLASVASELGHNGLRHGVGARLAVRVITRGEHRGVEIVAADRGVGIVDPRRALAGAPRGGGSLGAGLAAVLELSDEIDVDVRVGEGTCVRARKLAAGAARHPQVGIYGRPIGGELRSGDHVVVLRDFRGLTVGLCDGLGHGPEARQAADVAIDALARNAAASPLGALEACHAAASTTRGGVMAVARLAVDGGDVEVASIGNVTTELVGPRRCARFASSSFVLGSPQRGLRIAHETRPRAPGDLLILFSDGVSARASVEDDLTLLRQHPVIVAHALVDRFARDHDDALVVVVR